MSLVSTIKSLTEFKQICQLRGLDLIEELLKGSPIRAPTFIKALEYLDKVKPTILIETGTSRGRFDINLPSICGDGASTLIFALWCSQNNAKIYTVDIEQVCIDNPIPSQMHHLNEYLAVKDKLHKSCCILIDDCGLPHGGKGLFVEKQLVTDNFKLVKGGYQHFYEK